MPTYVANKVDRSHSIIKNENSIIVRNIGMSRLTRW